MFTHIFFGSENCAHRLHQKKYTAIFLRAETLPRTVFTRQQLFRTEAFTDRFFLMHGNYYRQMVFTHKVLRTEVLRTEGFTHNSFFTYRRCFYTQMPLHGRRIAHRNLRTQHSFARNQFLHREVLFPFLITYLSRSPSQVEILILTCLELLSLGGRQ